MICLGATARLCLPPAGSACLGDRFGGLGVKQRHLSCQSPARSEKFGQRKLTAVMVVRANMCSARIGATQLELPKCAVLLAVAKDGFDQLANDLTRGIAGMASGARIRSAPDREDKNPPNRAVAAILQVEFQRTDRPLTLRLHLR
jgi:hypothetical protein